MMFKKHTRLYAAMLIALGLTFSTGVVVGVAAGPQPASTAPQNANTKSVGTAIAPKQSDGWDLGNVRRWNISVEAENVIVRRGGTSFKIEVSSESKDSYLLEDYSHVITERFQEREITLQRKENLGSGAVFSATIIITVPDNAKNVLNSITTTSGDISIENSHADKIIAVSDTGAITITNSYAVEYIIAEAPYGTVTLKDTTSAGEVQLQDKNTAKIGNQKKSHLSQSGYSKDEFAAMLKTAKSYAATIAIKEKLGTVQYAGEIFDLDAVKGTVTIHFDLPDSKYETLAIDINSKGKVVDYRYWTSPE